MKNEYGYEFKKVVTQKLNRFSEMMDLSLNLKVDEDYFQWKYANNPAGKVEAFEAIDGDKSIGFFGVIPEHYLVNGKKVTVYQSMDLMTHPDHRRRGLFVTLAKMTQESLIERFGEAFIIGISGMNAFSGYINKLDWQNPHNFDYIFNHKLKFKLQFFTKKNQPVTLEPITQFEDDFDVFFQEKYQSPKPIIKFLSKEVLNWKIINHPFHTFFPFKIKKQNQTVGFIIYRMFGQKRCFIDYLELRNKEDFAELGPSIMRELYRISKADFIFTWRPTSKIIEQAYTKSGFIKNPFNKGPFSYRIPYIAYSNVKKIQGVEWFNMQNLDIQPILQD